MPKAVPSQTLYLGVCEPSDHTAVAEVGSDSARLIGPSRDTQRTPAALAKLGTAPAGNWAAKALMRYRSLVTTPPMRVTSSSALASLTDFWTMTRTISSGRSAAIASKSGWAWATTFGTGAIAINGNSSATASKTLIILFQLADRECAISLLIIT